MKTSELIGPALDWAVGTACGLPVEVCQIFQYGRPSGKHYISIGETDRDGSEVDFNPCEEWSQGGPIIEREGIELRNNTSFSGGWEAWKWIEEKQDYLIIGKRGSYCPTPLVAAMRAFVASRLGDEVDIPEELK